jgi:hypothetical protein
MSNRKYEKVSNYWVYSIKVPSVNKYYIGVSQRKKCWQRWQKSKYKETALKPYLDEWDSMIKTVLVDNLSKEQAYQYEDALIQALRMNDLCVNSNRSGLIFVSDENAYKRELLKNNTEYREREKQRTKQYCKQRYENDAEYRERKKQQARQRRLKKKQQQTVVH